MLRYVMKPQGPEPILRLVMVLTLVAAPSGTAAAAAVDAAPGVVTLSPEGGGTCGGCIGGVITCTGSIEVTDPDAGQRLAVNGLVSTCISPTLCPLPAASGIYRYDVYTGTNILGVPTCFAVGLNNAQAPTCGIALISSAYSPSFVPGTGQTCTNYVADVGISVTPGGSGGYSFTLAAGQAFQVIVMNRNANQVCNPGGIYGLTLTPCTTFVPVSLQTFEVE